jgi:uncharacterized protein (DUF885 family)
MSRGRGALAALALVLALAPAAAAAPRSAELEALVADYDRFARAADPLSAGLEGDREALTRWPDDSPAAVAARVQALKGFGSRLQALQGAELTPEEALDRDDLAWIVQDTIEGEGFDPERIPFSSDSGPFDVPDYVGRTTAVHDRADAEAWLQRLQGLPAWYDAEMANVRRGMATGFVLPRQVAEIVARDARAHAAEPLEQSALLLPFRTLPSTIAPAEQEALRRRLRELVATTVRPREKAYAELLAGPYLAAARPGIAASELPDGRVYYAWLARHHTTTSLTPDQIHALGEQEVARIRARMDAVIAETGYKGSFAQFLQFLRTDPRFYVTTRPELIEKASEIAKRIDYQLPHWFGTLPRLTYGVVEVPRDIEESYTTGRYFPGSPDQGIAGAFLVNTSHLDQRPLYELPALTLHEAVPGHHLQIALSQERKDLPFFRRNGEMTAFVEGWGLYAEGLGEEMGIYRDPYERFGRLSYEMWRACRLVADTGMHWLGWSRARARECFEKNTALSAKNIEVELDRYVSWPGQALAYKVGELRLREIRRKAEAALGGRFDIRSFHDALLREGPLPLDLLQARMDAWIAAQAQGPR